MINFGLRVVIGIIISSVGFVAIAEKVDQGIDAVQEKVQQVVD